jgi:hypothetical protein
MEIYASWIFVAYMVVSFAGAIAVWRFRKRLRQVSPDLAAKYATPFFKTTIAESWAGLIFLLRHRYHKIRDRSLDRIGDWACRLFWIMVALWAVFVSALILASKGY